MTERLHIRLAQTGDAGALAELRVLSEGREEPSFATRLAEWLAAEGDRRTTWLAMAGGEAAGMTSLFEYRRMPRPGLPDSRWGYVGNMFVRAELRGHGIGGALLDAVIACADEREYARLVVSPSEQAQSLYRRAGFVDSADAPGHRLLVRAAAAARTAGTGSPCPGRR